MTHAPPIESAPPARRQPLRTLLLQPRFPLSFWSWPETVKLRGRKAQVPPLGLLTVAALLPPDWPVRLVDQNVRPLTEEDWAFAEVVMVTGMAPQARAMQDVVREALRRGKRVVAGGPLASATPDVLRDAGCHIVVQGEAEAIVEELLDTIASARTGVILQAATRPDPSRIPVPRFELIDPADYVSMIVQTSRGCPYDCEFCDVISLFGRVPRVKAPAQIIAELEAVRRIMPHGSVFFADDNFIGARPRAVEILKALIAWNRSAGEPFGYLTQVTLNLAQDPELVDLMTAANFGEIFIGVESPDVDVLRASSKEHNTRQSIEQALTTLCASGLTVIASFIIGLDGEQPGADRRIAELVEAVGIPVVMINLAMAPPGTRLWKRLEREGRLVHGAVGDGGWLVQNLVPTRPVREIHEEYRRLWERLYEVDSYLERIDRYYRRMRPTRAALARAAGRTYDGPLEPPRPLAERLFDLKCFVRLCWRQGVLSPARLRFWRQLLGMWWHNPSRIVSYVVACGALEDLSRYRDAVASACRAAAALPSPDPVSAVSPGP